MRILIISLVALMISGCASVQEYRHGSNALPKLSSSGSAYILLPADAMYYTKVCSGSGNVIAQAISLAFSKHLNRVEISDSTEDVKAGLDKARQKNFTYLVDSKINRWEDYVTEWNGKLDRIQMSMNIYDVSTNSILDSVTLEGNGTWFTLGGYHPQNIVKKSIDEYVTTLFQSGEQVSNK